MVVFAARCAKLAVGDDNLVNSVYSRTMKFNPDAGSCSSKPPKTRHEDECIRTATDRFLAATHSRHNYCLRLNSVAAGLG